MKLLCVIALIMCCILAMWGCSAESTLPALTEPAAAVFPLSPPPTQDKESRDALSGEELRALIDHSVILIAGEPYAYVYGQQLPLTTAPCIQNGVMYSPCASVTVALGGSFISSDDVYYMNYMNNVSAMMTEYNVMLFNTDAEVMDATPIIVSNELCLPTESLAVALSMSCQKSPFQQMYLLGAPDEIKEHEFARLRTIICGMAADTDTNAELSALAERYSVEYGEVVAYAVKRTLWETNAEGEIFRLWLDDACVLQKTAYLSSTKYPCNSLFTIERRKQGQMLCNLADGSEVSLPPDKLYELELRSATARYMELKAATDINDDAVAEELLSHYANAIAGKLNDSAYIADNTSPYETHLYDNAAGADSWENLLNNAKVGDFLVFSAAGAAAKYGFFNHSSLIIEKNESEKYLRLLHARGAEYGVGADMEVDILRYESFNDTEYYQGYDTVFLCGAIGFFDSLRTEMAELAYEKYNGYQFGYGGRAGLEETNCTELIDEAYLAVGVDIIEGDYESRLKEVLKGNTRNFVLIPDDLLFSAKIEVLAVWKR